MSLNKKITEIKNKFKDVAKLVNSLYVHIQQRKHGDMRDLYGSIKLKEITDSTLKKKRMQMLAPSQIVLKDELNKNWNFFQCRY